MNRNLEQMKKTRESIKLDSLKTELKCSKDDAERNPRINCIV